MTKKNGTVIAFTNQKGGVGKTTLCVNLAAVLAEEGYKVLIIDNDSQANVTTHFLQEEYEDGMLNVLLGECKLEDIIVPTTVENLEISINSLESSDITLKLSMEFQREFKLREALEKSKIKQKYDYILIDCNPSLDLSLVNALVAADKIIIPLDASNYALGGLKKLNYYIEKVNTKMNPELKVCKIVLNNTEARSALGKEVKEILIKSFGDVIAKTNITRNALYSKLQYNADTVINHKKTKPYQEIRSLMEEIKNDN